MAGIFVDPLIATFAFVRVFAYAARYALSLLLRQMTPPVASRGPLPPSCADTNYHRAAPGVFVELAVSLC